MLKRVWSAVLIIAMLLSSNYLSVFAQEESHVEQLECQVMEWEVNNNLPYRHNDYNRIRCRGDACYNCHLYE